LAGGAIAVKAALTKAARIRSGAVALVTLLIAYEVTARTNSAFSYAFVPLGQLVRALLEVSVSGELFDNIVASLSVVLHGLVLGGSAGVLIGGAMAYSKPIAVFVNPLFNAWRPVPMLGMIPLIALWFGNGETSKLVLVSLAAAEPMILNTYEGLRGTDARYLEGGRALTFSRWQLFRLVQLPAALPSMFTGLQHALGFAWIATIGAELLFTIGPGLGGVMERAQLAARMDVVIVCVVAIGVVGLAMNTAFTRLSAHVLRWRESQ
jgi:sulfonate transport system permease protein